ncbi:MAG: DJ-1/PfpI family protein [Candidatus Omnitrophica bacterium]|jgi:protease I|nr:DJ-1/PfpI family protein [Candidatus Omnitrophota bacterium]
MRKLFFAAAAAALLFVSASAGVAYAAQKAVFVIAEKNFQDDEFAEPRAILQNNGITVTVASTTLDQVTGMNGSKVKPDMLLKDVKAVNYDAVVFIGGSGAVQYIDDPVAHKLAQDAIARKKVVGGICLAPMILAKSGVLKDKKATVYPSEGDKLKACSVDYTAKPVQIDGNIVTADGPKSAASFGRALVMLLKGGN